MNFGAGERERENFLLTTYRPLLPVRRLLFLATVANRLVRNNDEANEKPFGSVPGDLALFH